METKQRIILYAKYYNEYGYPGYFIYFHVLRAYCNICTYKLPEMHKNPQWHDYPKLICWCI